MRILFLQPELMHAYIRAQYHKEIPQVYVHKKSIVHDFKEIGVTYKYSEDPVDLGYGFDFVVYQENSSETYDKVQLTQLIMSGLKPVLLTSITQKLSYEDFCVTHSNENEDGN